jgi:opacity protein-like surface antigen
MFSNLMKSIVTASFCLAAFAPAGAAPMVVQKPAIEITGSSGLVEVQYRDRHRRDFRERHHHKRRGFYRHHKRGYYNGHRGYRHKRHGYRHYNGYWFPPAAFSFGVIIGGNNRGSIGVRPGYTNPQHVRWCHNKYRSYDQRTNTFQPYHGPRRECRSPYY